MYVIIHTKESIMTVRKNFLLDEETAEHLKKIASKENTTQTQVIKNMIEEKYSEISVEEKLEALASIVGTSNGLYFGKSIQSIKADMDV